MATLPKLIRYHSLVNRLTDNEFNQFTSHLVKICGRDAISKPFCNRFMQKQPQNTANIHQIDTAINIMKTIMRSRHKCESMIFSIKPKFNVLPHAIIGEIGSYLNQNDHISLSKTNRRLYIGCNEPNTLQHLNVRKFQNQIYSQLNLQKYPQLRHLEIAISKLIQSSISSNRIFLNDLTQLTLQSESNSGSPPNYIDIVSKFAKQKMFDFNGITHLHLFYFGRISFDALIQLLLLFPNIEYLCLTMTTPNNIDSEFDLKSVLPKLKGYGRSYAGRPMIINKIISSFGSSLTSLRLNDLGNEDAVKIASDMKFSNLEELCVEWVSDIDKVNTILDTAISLKRLILSNLSCNIKDKRIIKDLMQKLIATRASMEHLIIFEKKDDYFDAVCDGIESGLYSLNRQTGNSKMTLNFTFGTRYLPNPKTLDILLKISRVATQLESSDIHNFMMTVHFLGIPDKDWSVEWQRFVRKYESKFVIGYCMKERLRIWLANKRCNINGYGGNPSWLISCRKFLF